MKEYIKLTSYRWMVNTGIFHYIFYYKDSGHMIRHREKDKPAFIRSDGSLGYYKNNKFVYSNNSFLLNK
jgi:hypothetical protein